MISEDSLKTQVSLRTTKSKTEQKQINPHKPKAATICYPEKTWILRYNPRVLRTRLKGYNKVMQNRYLVYASQLGSFMQQKSPYHLPPTFSSAQNEHQRGWNASSSTGSLHEHHLIHFKPWWAAAIISSSN